MGDERSSASGLGVEAGAVCLEEGPCLLTVKVRCQNVALLRWCAEACTTCQPTPCLCQQGPTPSHGLTEPARPCPASCNAADPLQLRPAHWLK